MSNIKVIIPLHAYNEEIKESLLKAIGSVPAEYDVLVSTTEDCYKQMSKDGEGVVTERVTIVWDNSGKESKSDFCSLVNNAVNGIDSEYFSILEYDDVYSDIWFKNVEEYLKYKPEVSVFLSLTDLIDYADNSFIGYGNEAPWASSFSNEIGYIDNDCLQNFFDFYLTGGVFNTKDWKSCGGLKPSIKLTFWYEFLLRLTNSGKEIFVIPKIGYKHFVNRPNSIYNTYRETMDEKESNFWFETAKQECVFKTDRNKVYNTENNNKEEE